jgi:hypothetical protein
MNSDSKQFKVLKIAIWRESSQGGFCMAAKLVLKLFAIFGLIRNQILTIYDIFRIS